MNMGDLKLYFLFDASCLKRKLVAYFVNFKELSIFNQELIPDRRITLLSFSEDYFKMTQKTDNGKYINRI